MTQDEQTQRAAFEAHIRSLPVWQEQVASTARIQHCDEATVWRYHFERSDAVPDMYYNNRLDDMWKGWLAAQTQRAPESDLLRIIEHTNFNPNRTEDSAILRGRLSQIRDVACAILATASPQSETPK